MKNGKKFLAAALAVLLVASCALIGRQLHSQRVAEEAYDQAQQLVTRPRSDDREEAVVTQEQTPTEPEQEPLEAEAEFLLELELDALREVNAEVLGWIYIPDTVVNYPLMDSGDNSKYLNQTWDGKYSKSGAIFLECMNSPDFSDPHTLIYGHNLVNGNMFSCLTEYQDQEFLDEHRLVYIALEDRVLRYEVFSAYTAGTDSDAYRLSFEDEAHEQSVLDEYLESSVVEGTRIPTPDDPILTLSTCTNRNAKNSRWVVHTLLTGVFYLE